MKFLSSAVLGVGHLDVSVVQSLGELLKLLAHPEGDGVVSEGAAGFDDVLVSLLLDHLPHLQLQSNLSQVRANTWGVYVSLECAWNKHILTFTQPHAI